MCVPFLRGFLPGTLVGVFTSLLLFSLWRHPYSPGSGTKDLGRDAAKQQETEGRATPAAKRLYNDMRRNIAELVEASEATILGSYKLLVLVHSSPVQRSLRDAARETWLRQRTQRDTYVARFVIGTRGLDEEALARLAEENAHHGDLVALSQVEEDALAEWPSSRKLLQSFIWAVSHANFTSIFKCNAATFAVMDQLLAKLPALQESYVWGYFAGGVKALRQSDAAVMVETDWTLCSHYLPYPQGGGYVISRDLVELVVSMGPDLKHYRHDDIALGVWLSPFKVGSKQHSLWFNTGHYSRGCRNSYLVTHRETEHSMRAKAHLLESKGVLCESEHQSRLSYRYNWTAPANHCCIRKMGIP